MNIISNFKDYYDHVAYLGIDKTIPFKRTSPKSGQPKTFWSYQSNDKSINRNSVIFNQFQDLGYYSLEEYWGKRKLVIPTKGFHDILGVSKDLYHLAGMTCDVSIDSVEGAVFGFCGKLYPCEIVRFKDAYLLNIPDQVLFRNTVKGDAWAELRGYTKEDKPNRKAWRPFLIDLSKQVSFGRANIVEDEILFKELNTPYFMVTKGLGHDYEVITEFPLANTEFPTVMSPEQAWTQLEFFLTNTLRVNEREMLEVSDEYKIMGAGFDLKTSFRHPVNPAKIK